MREDQDKGNKVSAKKAWRFIILMGFVSLFADVTYEGARSITGPFLAVLGASGAVVGFVAGLGELIGYGLRLVSGYFSDRTRKYWTFTLWGYFINLLAVPALAWAGNWPLAAMLIIAERTGKAIRSPARDVILSLPAHEVGRGKAFAIHEAMDQIGAVCGPLLMALIAYWHGSYRSSFAFLLLPAVIALAILLSARFKYPNPSEFESGKPGVKDGPLPSAFWFYLAGASLIAAGFADFPLIAYHFKKIHLVADAGLPLFYALAMGVDAVAALVFGYFYDRIGFPVLIIAAFLSSLFAPLAFLGGVKLALLGVVLWGVGMGAQESVLRAAVADMVNMGKRGTAYGLFNMGYGIFWFAGSALMGYLYDVSLKTLIGFSIVIQLLAIPLLYLASRKFRPSGL